jgi:hypothetical protein
MKVKGVLVTAVAALLLMQCPQVLAQPTDASDPVTLKDYLTSAALNNEGLKAAFEQLSNEMIAVVKQFGIAENRVLYRLHCPMAFNNKGADWLQRDEDTCNPYFGALMLKCGEIAEAIGAKKNEVSINTLFPRGQENESKKRAFSHGRVVCRRVTDWIDRAARLQQQCAGAEA